MASFQAKIGWKMPGKGENKNTVMALSHPFRPKQVGKRREREKKKIIVPLRSYPTRNRKFQRNSKEIKKVKKYHYGFILSQKQVGKGGERDNKNYRDVQFLHDV